MSSDRPPAESEATSETRQGTGDGLTPEQRLQWKNLDVQVERAMLIWRLGIMLVTSISLVGVFWLLSSNTGRIAHVGYARGLITVLFSVGVVTMALIIVLTLLLQKRDNSEAEAEASEKRFQRTKEILTLLLGILGTVVGFYFGTTSESHDAPTVANVVVSEEALVPGAKVDLTVLIRGGTAPYTYRIGFEGLNITALEGQTDDQWITDTLTIPDSIGGVKEFKANVEITDSSGVKSALTRTISLSAPQTETSDEQTPPPATNRGGGSP